MRTKSATTRRSSAVIPESMALSQAMSFSPVAFRHSKMALFVIHDAAAAVTSSRLALMPSRATASTLTEDASGAGTTSKAKTKNE
jgi:hypothetical protein